MAAKERAYLQARLRLVERRLGGSEPVYAIDRDGTVSAEHYIEHGPDVALQRERRLLSKLLMTIDEGEVLRALRGWRRSLSRQFREHRRQTESMQAALDAWWQLPPDRRDLTPKPERPPSLFIRDGQGYRWIIDEPFLELIDDVAARLQKWLATGEEEPGPAA